MTTKFVFGGVFIILIYQTRATIKLYIDIRLYQHNFMIKLEKNTPPIKQSNVKIKP